MNYVIDVLTNQNTDFLEQAAFHPIVVQFSGKKKINTIKKACKVRGRLASTSAVEVAKRTIDIMLDLLPLSIKDTGF